MHNLDYDYSTNTFLLQLPVIDNDLPQQIPGARWDKKQYAWRIHAGIPQVWAMGAALKGKLFPTPNAEQARDYLLAPSNTEVLPIPGLYPFQQDGVQFLTRQFKGLLADEMGTGKTVQMLSTLRTLHAHYTLVVCTNSMKHKWAAEAAIWYPEAQAFVVEGTPAKKDQIISTAYAAGDTDPVIVIVNYESLRALTKLAGFGSLRVTDKEAKPGPLNLIPWEAVVADEAHRVKDPRSKQTRALWGVSREAHYRYALTGTPVVNNPDDLWTIMHFVDHKEWPSRNAFRERYCLMYSNPHGGYENMGVRPDMQPELQAVLASRMIRRTKAEVLPDLPTKTYDMRPLPLTSEQAKVYTALRDEMLAQIDDGLLVVTDPLILAGRLRQAACAMPVLDADGNVTALRTPSNKIAALLELIEDSTGPLVVFAESRKLIELAAACVPTGLLFGTVTGTDTPAERERTVRKFQAGALDIVLCTTGAGAEGITLTSADTLVFLQQSWSNVANKQAEDRIHRIGQESPVQIITFISEGTIEDAVYAVTREKEDRLQEVVRDADWLRRNL